MHPPPFWHLSLHQPLKDGFFWNRRKTLPFMMFIYKIVSLIDIINIILILRNLVIDDVFFLQEPTAAF